MYVLCILLAVCSSARSEDGAGEPLYLTPFIESGAIQAGRDASRMIEPMFGMNATDILESYSGYITTNWITHAETFFWFFPATEVDPTDAPIVAYLGDDYLAPSVFSALNEVGPYRAFRKNGEVKIERNAPALTTRANVIFIDTPIGNGFSHGYEEPESLDDIAENLHSFMKQWIKLFPEFEGSNLFGLGSGFGGDWVSSFGLKMNSVNDVGLIFKGIGIMSELTSPINRVGIADYAYQLGLVDEITLNELKEFEALYVGFLLTGEYGLAALSFLEIELILVEATDCNNLDDVRECDAESEADPYPGAAAVILSEDVTKRALHAGDLDYIGGKGSRDAKKIARGLRSTRDDLRDCLERFPVLLFNGNMNLASPTTGTHQTLKAMRDWSGLEEYLAKERGILHELSGEVAGYIKIVDNLRLAVIRNAGFDVVHDQPERGVELFEAFVYGRL